MTREAGRPFLSINFSTLQPKPYDEQQRHDKNIKSKVKTYLYLLSEAFAVSKIAHLANRVSSLGTSFI
jgi:hypothetical protein